MSKKVNKKTADKAPRSQRFGAFLARATAGTAVKTGRLAAKAAKGTASVTSSIRDGFASEMDKL